MWKLQCCTHCPDPDLPTSLVLLHRKGLHQQHTTQQHSQAAELHRLRHAGLSCNINLHYLTAFEKGSQHTSTTPATNNTFFHAQMLIESM